MTARILTFRMGRGSSVGIATRYGLDGPEIGSQGGEIVRIRSDWGSPSLVYRVTGVKRPVRGVDHSPPSSAKVKERVQLYLYPLLWTFVVCSRVSFTFTLTFTALQGTFTNAVFIWKGDKDWPIRKDVKDVVAYFKTLSCTNSHV